MSKTSSLRLAAIVMKSLPRAQAEKLATHLDASEMAKLQGESNRVPEVSLDEIQETMDRLESATQALKDLEESQYGTDRPPIDDPENSPLAFLEELPMPLKLKLLADEHPKNVATALCWMKQDQASELLNELEPEIRVSVVRRLCDDAIGSDDDVAELAYMLKLRLKQLTKERTHHPEGVQLAARVISCIDPDVQDDLIDYIRQLDPKLAEQLQHCVFHFPDIEQLSDEDVKTLLRNVDTSVWAPALKRARLKTQTKVLRNLAETPSKILNREITEIGTVDEHLAYRAQRQIINTALQLIQDKQILPPGIRKS